MLVHTTKSAIYNFLPHHRWDRVLLFALAFFLGFVFFIRSFNAYFVADDYEFADIITFEKSLKYFGTGFGTTNEYRPLLPITYAMNQAVGRGSPIPFHITNTAIHICNAILLCTIAEAVGISFPFALAAMLFFAMNPVVHESLLWISARPVLLGSFFVLLAIRLFLKPQAIILPGVVACFVLALGVYEVAIVLPFALTVLCLLHRFRTRYRLTTLGVLFTISAIYIFFWLRLFHFGITRFPIERSLAGMSMSLLRALLHSLHGCVRPLPGSVYAILLLYFLRTKQGRRATLVLLCVFTAFYLPFFLVRGFADRFAYLSSTAAMLWLASALSSIANRAWRVSGVVATILFFAVGIQNRISTWNEAGEIARSIPLQIKKLAPDLPAHAKLLIEDAPVMHKNAYVFITGLPNAIDHAYGRPIDVQQIRTSERYAVACRWDGHQIVRSDVDP